MVRMSRAFSAAIWSDFGIPKVKLKTGHPTVEMNVGEVSGRLDSLSDEELKRVRDYERRHKNRDTLIEQLDRKIKASS